MTTQNRKKDDELTIWLAVGSVFTLFMIGIDIWYSSISQMEEFIKYSVYAFHALLGFLWVLTIVKFTDPDYDWSRKYVVYLSVIISLIVGIHHASVREDKQVIIDSRENAAKDSLK